MNQYTCLLIFFNKNISIITRCENFGIFTFHLPFMGTNLHGYQLVMGIGKKWKELIVFNSSKIVKGNVSMQPQCI